MDSIFTIPFSEYSVIEHIQRELKKKEGFSVFIPTSRQQKGIDFLLHYAKNNRTLRFQVKSSKTYIHDPKRSSKKRYNYYLWLNNFIEKYEKGNSDYYIIFGLYPVYDNRKNIKSKFWKSIVLCYSEEEMFELLNQVKTKKEQKVDPFFGYGFDNDTKIFATRGLAEEIDSSQYLLKNQIVHIKHKIINLTTAST